MPAAAPAQSARPSLQDSFRLGNAGGSLCQMQSQNADPAARGMFDRAWSIVCRDAARPIGQIYALRDAEDGPARLAASRETPVTCDGEASAPVADLGTVSVTTCRLANANVGYKIYRTRIGRVTYLAQGLAGYDSALELGLRTIVADRIVDGEIRVATTGLADPVAFARVQAGALDPAQTLAEGYRRNNSGNYAEAAEFFDTLQSRLDAEDATRDTPANREQRLNEYLVNQALQKSNLGEFAEADALFAAALRIPTLDPVQTRLRRNFEALHLLNQRKLAEAAAVLARPVTPIAGLAPTAGAVEIGAPLAAEINSSLPAARRLGATQSAMLSPEERVAILDAQALQLRATVLRLQGNPAPASAMLDKALADATAIREGRVTSITRLRAQIMAENALTHEDRGDFGSAEALLRRALDLLRTSYPETTAMNGGRARLAAFLVRRGKRDEAMTLYREVVASTTESRANTTGLANLLAPYFQMLAEQVPSRPALVSDLFLASQTLVRPGVADTQAVLARELRDGGGEPARLFRQAVTLSRDIERTRIEMARLGQIGNPDASVRDLIAARDADLKTMVEQQSLTFARLSEYPQYRALSTEAMTLDDLKAALKPGEAYYKMAIAGRDIYAVYLDARGATAWRLPISATTLDAKVSGLRDTISTIENGQNMTYPFDVKLARSLYSDLFDPVAQRLASVEHLIFEPDGAMLRLPVNLLIADQAGVDAYLARTADPNADEFDFRGIDWLGRRHAVSTAVSARAFRDTRRTPASAAAHQYIGFGDNAPASGALVPASATRSPDPSAAIDCAWPLSEWNKPIAAAELRQAAAEVGAGASQIVTGNAFTDTAVRGRTDLADYRILHFATHGLVTAPRPECPARPALLTSFGGGDSDGLLSFREIYDLKIDADVVILSACDTAGEASRDATREAGVTTGGGSALDGLVRAFIGAGGRSVIASHWPAPDDFNATRRLIAGLFEGGAGRPIAFAMKDAERGLMDEAATSHPYYWSGFAIIGDGAQQLIVKR
ncbi:CHAT domain-containing protein [Sphingomonas colocasiae]|uniref:CHAT domain-containing protein n=2 Tax=Sphingomonas colocasiae TaxID=1848973 RepID=A0ABS7PN92_9SPHN|nr:CHAT domain-containing protein [Sphingomonas colocasiae]MBY8822785.1 CHAT domain-containing protein [Sphingomonas colocasiae]